MEAWLQSSIHWLFLILALPRVGLSAIFVVSLLSATLLPIGSEPAVFGFVKLAPHMFWPAVLVATLGNTVGGMVTYAMGIGAEKAYERWRIKHGHAPDTHDYSVYPGTAQPSPPAGAGPEPQAAPHTAKPVPATAAAGSKKIGGRWHAYISYWAHHLGPALLFFSWLPVVGDPLCAVAGWLRLSFWPSMLYMALGKFLRYGLATAAFLWLF